MLFALSIGPRIIPNPQERQICNPKIPSRADNVLLQHISTSCYYYPSTPRDNFSHYIFTFFISIPSKYGSRA